MFGRTTNKLEDARVTLEKLEKASDAQEFKALFNAFLSSARAITNGLQKDGAKIAGFSGWYAEKQEEMRGDPLLRFIHDARTVDFHEGSHGFRFSTHIKHLSTDQLGPPPVPNAGIAVNASGVFWVVDRGTPKERLIPIKSGGTFSTNVSLVNAPGEHLGKKLEKNDPITVCSLALDYYENLVFEAKGKFKD